MPRPLSGSEPLHGQLSQLYGPHRVRDATARMRRLLRQFDSAYPGSDCDTFLISAPGRTELAGNHTDHNGGLVIAAAVDLDALGLVRARHDRTVRIRSHGYPGEFVVRLDDLSPRAAERGRFDALIRGVAAGLVGAGCGIAGFDCCMHSLVTAGAGLSSSAAVEVFVAAALCAAARQPLPGVVELALIAQRAENRYFGKPCGLMDQLACAHGGTIAIDFGARDAPRITPLPFDPQAAGYDLVVVDSKASHDDLTEDYAAVPADMHAVADAMGATNLSQLTLERLLDALGELRRALEERALLRALHFFNENRRVDRQIAALRAGEFNRFLEMVHESGSSSWRLLQNCIAPGHGGSQPLALALALSEQLLDGYTPRAGACRVHGGGFAGTMQAYVPSVHLGDFVERTELVFGSGSVTPLSVRRSGPQTLCDATGLRAGLKKSSAAC